MDGKERDGGKDDQDDSAAPPTPSIFHAPEAPPIPELLRKPGPRAAPQAPADGSGMSDMSKAWGVAMDFVFTIIGAALLGYFADRWLQTNPRYTLIGLSAGFAFALVRIIRRTMADERREQERRRGGGSGSR